MAFWTNWPLRVAVAIVILAGLFRAHATSVAVPSLQLREIALASKHIVRVRIISAKVHETGEKDNVGICGIEYVGRVLGFVGSGPEAEKLEFSAPPRLQLKAGADYLVFVSDQIDYSAVFGGDASGLDAKCRRNLASQNEYRIRMALEFERLLRQRTTNLKFDHPELIIPPAISVTIRSVIMGDSAEFGAVEEEATLSYPIAAWGEVERYLLDLKLPMATN